MKKLLSILVVLLSLASATVQAQDTGMVTYLAYYTASDGQGVQQVFQLVLNQEATHRQITQAESDVLSYGVSYDRMHIAYISEGTLWLQAIEGGEAEALTAITATDHFPNPVFSPDSQTLAYADHGVWLLELSTRKTRQLLVDVPFTEASESVGVLRVYAPERFIWQAYGQVNQLVVEIGMWEWSTAGIVDLATGELQLIEDITYTDLLPLYGSRVLVYGNNAMNGNPEFYVADDDDVLADYHKVFDFSTLVEDAIILFASQAVEIAPGTVRVMGTTLMNHAPDSSAFYFDYDLMANQLLGVNTFAMLAGETNPVEMGQMSPDGALVPMLRNIEWSEAGRISGQLTVIELVSGDERLSMSDVISNFQWQA